MDILPHVNTALHTRKFTHKGNYLQQIIHSRQILWQVLCTSHPIVLVITLVRSLKSRSPTSRWRHRHYPTVLHSSTHKGLTTQVSPPVPPPAPPPPPLDLDIFLLPENCSKRVLINERSGYCAAALLPQQQGDAVLSPCSRGLSLLAATDECTAHRARSSLTPAMRPVLCRALWTIN